MILSWSCCCWVVLRRSLRRGLLDPRLSWGVPSERVQEELDLRESENTRAMGNCYFWNISNMQVHFDQTKRKWNGLVGKPRRVTKNLITQEPLVKRVWKEWSNETGDKPSEERALEQRDDWSREMMKNTKSENVITNEPFCSEGSRVVQYQTFVKFPIFSWNTSTHLGHEVIKPKCLNTSTYS